MSLSHIRALNEMLLELLPESSAQAAQFDAGEAEQRRLPPPRVLRRALGAVPQA